MGSKDKYPSLFSHQMEAIVFVILDSFENWGPSFSWEIFGHVTYLMDYKQVYLQVFYSRYYLE